jgi:hypothetical protein
MFLVEGIDLIDALLRDDDCNAMKIIDNFDNSKSNGTKIPYSIAKYEKDLTALAKEGKLEPIIGREAKINRMINVLMRKNKCNPCLIGKLEKNPNVSMINLSEHNLLLTYNIEINGLKDFDVRLDTHSEDALLYNYYLDGTFICHIEVIII